MEGGSTLFCVVEFLGLVLVLPGDAGVTHVHANLNTFVVLWIMVGFVPPLVDGSHGLGFQGLAN